MSATHHEDFLKYVKTLYGYNCHSYYIDLSLEETKGRYREKPREEYETGSLDKWYIEANYSSVLMEKVLDGRLKADQLAETICQEMLGRK